MIKYGREPRLNESEAVRYEQVKFQTTKLVADLLHQGGIVIHTGVMVKPGVGINGRLSNPDLQKRSEKGMIVHCTPFDLPERYITPGGAARIHIIPPHVDSHLVYERVRGRRGNPDSVYFSLLYGLDEDGRPIEERVVGSGADSILPGLKEFVQKTIVEPAGFQAKVVSPRNLVANALLNIAMKNEFGEYKDAINRLQNEARASASV